MIAGISENDRSQTMADGRAREVTGHLGFSLVCSRPFGKTGDRSIVSYLVRPMPFMSPSGTPGAAGLARTRSFIATTVHIYTVRI
jgi:hypothetical protein